MRAGESDAYWESPRRTGRLGRSVYIEASWLNLPIFFSTFLQHEKVYSDDQFLVTVRTCGHFLVSAKPVKSVQSTLRHLKSTSVPCATFTRFFVEHELFQHYLF